MNAPGGIHVTVRLHGLLAERAGRRTCALALPAGSVADGIWSALAALAPDIEAQRGVCALARNGEWAAAGETLAEGDEIDVVPPVSGG